MSKKRKDLMSALGNKVKKQRIGFGKAARILRNKGIPYNVVQEKLTRYVVS